MFTEAKPGSYLLLGVLFEVVEGRGGRGRGLGPEGGFVGRRSGKSVVVVVAQPAALAASLGLLLVPRRHRRRPQLPPPPFLPQRPSGFVPRVPRIVAATERRGVVVLGAGFIALSRGASEHVAGPRTS